MGRRKNISRVKSVKRKTGSRRTRDVLRRIHESRKPHAQLIDESLVAKRARTPEQWIRDPSRSDVAGVDLPMEWRSEFERKDLKTTREELADLKGLSKTRRLGPKDRELMESLKLDLELLEWQQKHPFISAGKESPFAGSSQEFEGIGNYKEAQDRDLKYGFNLRRPQESFLDAHNLKQRDIKGMRIFLYTSKPRFHVQNPDVTSSALAFYRPGTKEMHIPPITRGTNTEDRIETIIHETGHHIYFTSHDLKGAWLGHKPWEDWTGRRRQSLLMKECWHAKRGKPAVVSSEHVVIRNVEVPPWQVAAYGEKFFGTMNPIDLSPWKRTHMREGGSELSWKRSDTIRQEAWAETFYHHRSGEWSTMEKVSQLMFQESKDVLDEHQQMMARYKGKKNTQAWRDMKTVEKHYMDSVRYYSAQYDNIFAFNKWLKHMDNNGWLMPKKEGKVRPIKK